MEKVLQELKSFEKVINEFKKSGLQFIPMDDEELANEERNYNNGWIAAKKDFRIRVEELRAIYSAAQSKGDEKVNIIDVVTMFSVSTIMQPVVRHTEEVIPRLLTTDSVITNIHIFLISP